MGDEEEEDEDTILTNSTSKLINLIIFLKRYVQENDSSNMKALVFVKRRYTAKIIYHILKRYARYDPDNFTITPDFMVGNNSTIPESIEAILENKWNRRVVERFRKNEINLIVASSVLEEGIDLQMCNLVLSYDSPETFRSYVQSKGRARNATSTYGILTSTADYSKLANKLRDYTAIDQILKDVRISAFYIK